jgi:catechol 2,3-dioxygenase-like lactoylglutathione lyase family enzyme
MRAGRVRTRPIAQEENEMKRFHVHVGVRDLDSSIRFYSGLFGEPPSVRKPDYAKWMIDEPRVNFAISQRGPGGVGVNHLGLQAESSDELAGIRARFSSVDASIVDEPDVRCCYARGDKHWVTDPQGIAWEAFHTLESVPMFGGSTAADATGDDACCSPATGATADDACCAPDARTRAADTAAAQPDRLVPPPAARKRCCG